ncbi:MAG: hypothetical protein ACOYEW_00835 [Anaerolineae bacterium]|jgi:hypothetical protein
MAAQPSSDGGSTGWVIPALLALALLLLVCGCLCAGLGLFGWFFSDASVLG